MLRNILTFVCSLLLAIACVAPGVCDERALEPLEPAGEPNRLPNVHVDISKELLNAVLGTNTRTRAPFREVIQGSVYRGTSTTDASFSLRTEPDDDAVALVFVWQAAVTSNSRSSTQRTDVSSRSVTHIGAIKRVAWHDEGWRVEPARALAKSHSKITGISVNRLIGRRIARRRAYERRGGVDRTVASRAQQRTRREFNRQIEAILASWQENFDERIGEPLAARGQLPQVIEQSSTADGVQLALLQARADQFGTVTGLSQRPADSSTGDLSLSLHQSALNNLAAGLVAGENLREDELADRLEQSLGWKLAGLAPSDSEKLWSIDFEKEHPVRVEFGDGRATVTLQARGFQVGEQRIPGARLRVTYDLAVADGKLTGARHGRIEIEPLAAVEADENVGVRFQVFRSMLRRRFDRLFPAEFAWTDFPTPGDWPERATLRFATATSEDQWLQLDCELAAKQSAKVARRAK